MSEEIQQQQQTEALPEAPKIQRAPKVRPEILQVKLTPSKQKDSKYTVKIEGGKSVSFGQKSASDFTINKSTEKQELYIGRHKKREEQFWTAE